MSKNFSIDFETLIHPLNNDEDGVEERKHTASGFSLLIIDSDNNIFYNKTFRGLGAADVFINCLYNATRQIVSEMNQEAVKMNPLTEFQNKQFKFAKICHICKKGFALNEIKTRDHNHRNGEYRGPAHIICNLKYQDPHYIPLFIHNLKNFDANLILNSLNTDKFKKCKIIPQSTEKFLSFSLDEIRLLDSYQFLSVSLAILVENLRKSGVENFVITRKVFEKRYSNFNEEKMSLLLRKGVFCYEYIDTFKKFDQKFLPSIDFFYSSLNFSTVSIEDYKHACIVFKEFQCMNIGEFHDLYCLLDTCLLADVMTVFRRKIFETYGLEACHFFSLPTLSFQAMLKYTGIEIELLTDVDMYIFIENNIKGGICQVSKRFSKSNNKYIEETYDQSKKSKFITYIDGE